MIKITLTIDGKEKYFRITDVRMRACLEAYRLASEYEKCNGDFSDEMLEKCTDFVCSVFGNAFTPEDLLDGYKGNPFALFPALLREVISFSSDKIAQFPTPAVKPKKTMMLD